MRIITFVENEELVIKYLTYDSSDTIEENASFLTSEEKRRVRDVKSSKRKKEIFFSRLLWNEMNGGAISYDGCGCPNIENGNISISHSMNMVAISFSKIQKFGIDLEFIQEKLLKVKDKFLDQNEYQFIQENAVMNIARIWSAKEAGFKYLGKRGISFKDHILVKELSESNGSLKIVNSQEVISLEFLSWKHATEPMILTLIGRGLHATGLTHLEFH